MRCSANKQTCLHERLNWPCASGTKGKAIHNWNSCYSTLLPIPVTVFAGIACFLSDSRFCHLDFVLILIFGWFLLVLIPFSSSCVLWPLFQYSLIQDILAHLISKIKHCIDWFGYWHSMTAVERGVGNHRVCKARVIEVDERIWHMKGYEREKGRKVSHTQSQSHWGARAQWNIHPTSINHWWFCCTSAKNPASPIPWASCARSWATSSPSLLSRVAGSWGQWSNDHRNTCFQNLRYTLIYT